MPSDTFFEFRFVRQNKTDPNAVLTEINQKAQRAAFYTMRDFVLPRLQREAPGTVAKQHFQVVNLGVSSRSVKYGIGVPKTWRYIFFTIPPGTQPHDIYPRTRKFLAFHWAGAPASMARLPDGRVLARKVHHPGYKGNAWVERATRGVDLRSIFIQGYSGASGDPNAGAGVPFYAS